MEIEVVKEVIKKYLPGHQEFIRRASEAERYYRSDNDILRAEREKDGVEEAVRKADNRIASGFYPLLVDQKTAYVFTAPPLFDVGDDRANKKVDEVLGDQFALNCAKLCVNASNAGVGWIYYWLAPAGGFRYAVLDPSQVIPVWDNAVDSSLTAVMRVYDQLNDNGRTERIYEYHTPETISICRGIGEDLDTIEPYRAYRLFDADAQAIQEVSEIKNPFGRITFIPFYNNLTHTGDLKKVKAYIDSYDKVYSGFVNDLEDIQEIIFILSGYEGEDLGEFLTNLKQYKVINLESDETGKGGLSTLSIEIPVEARKELLTIARSSIFEQGMGIDPDPQNFGNSSGTALEYLYSLLEQKAGMLEIQFKPGFAALVCAICGHLGIPCKKVIQTWTRTKVRSETALCDIADKSVGVISRRTIVANHPWVEDPDKELVQIEQETAAELEKGDVYTGSFDTDKGNAGGAGDVNAKR